MNTIMEQFLWIGQSIRKSLVRKAKGSKLQMPKLEYARCFLMALFMSRNRDKTNKRSDCLVQKGAFAKYDVVSCIEFRNRKRTLVKYEKSLGFSYQCWLLGGDECTIVL